MKLTSALTVACVLVVTARIAGQGVGLPRTPWGEPDLRGTWPGSSVASVSFERDPSFGTRATLTPEETAKQNAMIDSQTFGEQANCLAELAHAPAITSLVVDPENGRLPTMTEDGARRAAAWRLVADPEFPAGSADQMRPYDRCISRGVLGSAFPNVYGSGMQIHQAPGVVVIRYEMVHEARIIPIDRRPHLSPAIRSYMGTPEAPGTATRSLSRRRTSTAGPARMHVGDGNPTSAALRLVERFRLRDERTLLDEVRIEDPQTWLPHVSCTNTRVTRGTTPYETS